MKHTLLYILLLAMCVSSCIYPFNPEEMKSQSGTLVVSGDIIVGERCKIQVSTLQPLSGEFSPTPMTRITLMSRQEDKPENVKEYHATALTSSGTYVEFNLVDAPADDEYQLSIKTYEENPRTYRTAWQKPTSAPIIGDLSFELPEDEETLRIGINLKGTDENQFYRWEYDEVWEYEADLIPFVLWTGDKNNMYLLDPFGFNNYFYCWAYNYPHKVGIGNAEKTEGNEIVNKELLSLSRKDERLKIIYEIKLRACSISKEAYYYLENIQNISGITGDLFTPTPSEVRGNVFNVDDPEEMVYGYVSVCHSAQKQFFIDNAKKGFYIYHEKELDKEFIPEIEPGRPEFDQLLYLYRAGFAPYRKDYITGTVYWINSRCIDCRTGRGRKIKPPYWPNQHL